MCLCFLLFQFYYCFFVLSSLLLVAQFELLIVLLYFVSYLIWILLVIFPLFLVFNVLSCWMVSVGLVVTANSFDFFLMMIHLVCVLLYPSKVVSWSISTVGITRNSGFIFQCIEFYEFALSQDRFR